MQTPKILFALLCSVTITALLHAQPLVSAAEVFAKASPSVARLLMLDENHGVAGSGSAFVVAENGLLLTNYHNLVDADDGWAAHGAQVELPLHGTFDVEGVVAYNAQQDWAVLKVAATDLPNLELGDARNLAKGEPVISIGYPVGLDARPTVGTFSGWFEGEVLHDASTSSGNSGGPLVDSNGKVIGITRGELRSRTEDIALNDLFFAVDVTRVGSVLSEPPSSLSNLPLVSPASLQAKSVSGSDVIGGGGGVPSGVWYAVGLGAGGAVAAVVAKSAVDSSSIEGPTDSVIASFTGRVAACSVETHQFQIDQTMEVDISLQPGGFINGYLLNGACTGALRFETFLSSSGDTTDGCGIGNSYLKQVGSCPATHLGGGAFALEPGIHTLAVHNGQEVSESYTFVVQRRN